MALKSPILVTWPAGRWSASNSRPKIHRSALRNWMWEDKKWVLFGSTSTSRAYSTCLGICKCMFLFTQSLRALRRAYTKESWHNGYVFGLLGLVFWYVAFWSFGLWSFGLLIFWSFGLLVFWSFGLLIFWYFCIFVFLSFCWEVIRLLGCKILRLWGCKVVSL